MVHGGLCHKPSRPCSGLLYRRAAFLFCTALLPTRSRRRLLAPCCSQVCCSSCSINLPPPQPDRSVKPVATFFKGTRHLDIVSATLNVAFGYAFILLFRTGTANVLIAGAAAILVDAIISSAMGNRRSMLYSGALRLFSAIVACALLYLAQGDALVIMALGVMVICWFLFRTVHCGCLAVLAAAKEFPVLYTSTWESLPPTADSLQAFSSARSPWQARRKTRAFSLPWPSSHPSSWHPCSFCPSTKSRAPLATAPSPLSTCRQQPHRTARLKGAAPAW